MTVKVRRYRHAGSCEVTVKVRRYRHAGSCEVTVKVRRYRHAGSCEVTVKVRRYRHAECSGHDIMLTSCAGCPLCPDWGNSREQV